MFVAQVILLPNDDALTTRMDAGEFHSLVEAKAYVQHEAGNMQARGSLVTLEHDDAEGITYDVYGNDASYVAMRLEVVAA